MTTYALPGFGFSSDFDGNPIAGSETGTPTLDFILAPDGVPPTYLSFDDPDPDFSLPFIQMSGDIYDVGVTDGTDYQRDPYFVSIFRVNWTDQLGIARQSDVVGLGYEAEAFDRNFIFVIDGDRPAETLDAYLRMFTTDAFSHIPTSAMFGPGKPLDLSAIPGVEISEDDRIDLNSFDRITLDDRTFGGLGNDTILLGVGSDTVDGGAGDDTFIVQNPSILQDELSGGAGIDTYVLGGPSGPIQVDLAAGTIARFSDVVDQVTGIENVTGNALDDTLLGDDTANVFKGLGGNDTMNGAAGNDTLDGGIGADLLIGGQGSDVFYVDNVGDRVSESRKWTGTDTVISSVDFRTGNRHIENVELTGDARIGAGNGLRNVITGNDGDNILDGGKNVDTLIGGLGDDRYLIRAPGDNAVEAADGGNDTVLAFRAYALDAHVENLFLQTLRNAAGEGVAGVNGIGNGIANTIIGNPFDNFITGREGNDTLKGQAGADTFVFDRALGADNIDRIIDFNTNEAAEGDRILLKQSIFAGVVKGELSALAFVAGTAAADAEDRLIFDRASGQLWFDSDGTGGLAQQLIATFEQNAQVTAADIEVF